MVVELLKGLGSFGSRAKSRGVQSCTAVGLEGGGRPSEFFDHLIALHCDPEGKTADNVGRLTKERYFRAVVQVPERA